MSRRIFTLRNDVQGQEIDMEAPGFWRTALAEVCVGAGLREMAGFLTSWNYEWLVDPVDERIPELTGRHADELQKLLDDGLFTDAFYTEKTRELIALLRHAAKYDHLVIIWQ